MQYPKSDRIKIRGNYKYYLWRCQLPGCCNIITSLDYHFRSYCKSHLDKNGRVFLKLKSDAEKESNSFYKMPSWIIQVNEPSSSLPCNT